MRFFTSRALSIGRQAFSQQPVSFTQRASLTTINTVPARPPTFKKHVSYKPNPLERPTNPNRKNKIPYKERPLKQAVVPLPSKVPKEVGTYLRYIIQRTPSSQIPVYRKWMSGGNRCIVIIKKVKGDRPKLVKDLSKDLEIKTDDIRINPVTQHIEIKGDFYAKTVQWVLDTGF
ncbi:mitochondrial large ribosomal subunit l49 [Fusarium longipes]|uniref:Large ribosomal subunit protein mL49 n=1 Tax=Fusarium longipes TaxID=694270 RepID=A0A395T5Q0_9HYPO|nr:mitochondrial large ribosomal subunit l49 [Fusarium longipes]